MSGIPLRRRLFLLTAVGILPLAVLAGVGIYALAEQQRAQAQQAGLELARSVGTAVDAELRSAIAVVETLSTTLTLDHDDLAGFRERALRTLSLEADWAAIVLSDPAGTTLADTRFAPGVPVPRFDERESFERVVRTREPAVGNLARSWKGAWLFPVRAPVMRGDELRYVVTALVEPEEIRRIVNRQQVPADWVISIVDGNGLRVARSRAHEENVGGRLSETVAAIVARGGSGGIGVAYTLEGERIFAPYSRLTPGGWSAVLGIPTATVERAAARSRAVYGGGVLLSIVLGGLAALWLARGISRPMADLRRAAQALGRGETPRLPETPIQEIRDVAGALAGAGEELARAGVQRDELLRKERHARETAEAADRAKDEFVAVLSHELRTPLNAVYGWARMLQGGQLQDRAIVERGMDAIVRNADVQVQLIDDLLDLSRITTGKMRLDVRVVELVAVLQAALDVVRPAAAAKAIQLEAVLDPDAGPVAGDPARLQQVVWNLLMNAVKFTPRGGRIGLRLQRTGAQVQIVVSDTGKGIGAEMLPHVFERFRQADSSSTRAHGGLGLGLALVKHLVELHGGTVVAQSEGEGKGATFTVSLPISTKDIAAQFAQREPASAPPLESSPVLVRLDGLRVLVVDDEADAVALAQTILHDAGADVRVCYAASEAIELLRGWRPDVLVSDIEMPGEDGYSLIRRLRALAAEDGGTIPAVALTAYGRMQDRTRSLAPGFSMHVPKPVDPGELTAIIATVAGSRRES